MRRFRPLLFWIFVGLFFTTASAVLFNAFGYRFNLERGIFIYTGSVTIKSTPEAVDIRIDGELVPQKRLGIINNSIHIDGLAPGEHFIEVSAANYLPWSKKTTIQSGLSTEFWNVVLAKKDAKAEILPRTAAAERIFQALEEGLLAVAKNVDGTLVVDVIDTDARTDDETVFSLPEASLFKDTEENIEWAPDSKKFSIPIRQDDRHLYAIVDRETRESSLLNDMLPDQEPSGPRWDPLIKDSLLYRSADNLYRLDIGTSGASPLLLRENVRAYDISGRNIYYLSAENGIVYRIPVTADAEAEPTQITLSAIDLAPHGIYSLVVYDDTRLSIREKDSGTLSVYNKISSSETVMRQIASGIRGVQFSDDGKKLLFFTDDEISVYFERDWDVQPIREQDTVVQIARFSSPIRNIQWTRDYEHVLFSLNGTVKMIELDNRDRRNIADVISFTAPLSQVLSRFEEHTLYFVTSPNDGSDGLSRLPLSESTGFFGL